MNIDKENNMKKQYYKFLYYRDGKITSAHGNHTWEIGKEYSIKGEVKKCRNGFHASKEPLDALSYVGGDVLALVTVAGQHDNDSDKVCYEKMTIVEAYHWTPQDSVKMAIYAAEKVINIYEAKYPNDSRPRDAIKAAKAYLKSPSNAAAVPYVVAGSASHRAAYAARAAAYAARAAAYAADAARAAAYAAYAARAAAYAAHAELTAKINRKFKAQIKKLQAIK